MQHQSTKNKDSAVEWWAWGLEKLEKKETWKEKLKLLPLLYVLSIYCSAAFALEFLSDFGWWAVEEFGRNW